MQPKFRTIHACGLSYFSKCYDIHKAILPLVVVGVKSLGGEKEEEEAREK